MQMKKQRLIKPKWQCQLAGTLLILSMLSFFLNLFKRIYWLCYSIASVFVVVQLLSHVCFFATPCTTACKVSLSFTISLTLLKLMSTESVMPSNHLILLPSILPNISIFSNESALCIKWLQYWSSSFSTRPYNSSELSLLYGPALTSIHDYWKTHNFCFTFWFFAFEACRVLAPWSGIKAATHALEGKVWTTGPTMVVPSPII